MQSASNDLFVNIFLIFKVISDYNSIIHFVLNYFFEVEKFLFFDIKKGPILKDIVKINRTLHYLLIMLLNTSGYTKPFYKYI